MLIFRSLLVLHLYLCLSSCSEADDDEDGRITSSTYTLSCAARKDISPCTCYQHGTKDMWIRVVCQKMNSFAQVIKTLRNKIERTNQINLIIEFSNLEDLPQNKFSDLETHILQIWLRKNELGGNLSNKSFEGVETVSSLLLIDSTISEFPGTIFEHMPNVETVTIQSTFIKSVSPADFKSLKNLRVLVIRKCNLTYIESDTFPPSLKSINLSMNNVTTLNHTLTSNPNLEVIELARNNIESLEGQLPDSSTNSNLSFLDVAFNKLTRLPKSFFNLLRLSRFYGESNRIESLDDIFSNKMKLTDLDVADNRITQLSSSEFIGCKILIHLNLSFNEIQNLNKSIIPLRSLQELYLTNNKMTEFSLQEIIGLRKLRIVDLSHNQLYKFIGRTKNETVLPETEVVISELELQYNELEILEGSLAIKGLVRLNISHNKLTNIPAEFLNGLSELEHLDISHNLLVSLYDLSKATLVSLSWLYANNNKITELSSNGFSAVCFMLLQNNKIRVMKPDFMERNQCVYRPGVNATLYVYLDGNSVLCRDDIQEILNGVESRNNTKIVGQCSKQPSEGLKYNVGQNNTDSSSITVVTLEHN